MDKIFYVHKNHLLFKDTFNVPLNKRILTIMEDFDFVNFGNMFNQIISKDGISILPQNIKSIGFGNCFNQPVDYLPNNLESLYLRMVFNQLVDNLPKNLKILSFDLFSFFNQEIDNLPQNLIKLELGMYFNKKLDFLPITLEELKIPNIYYRYDLVNLPPNLKVLTISKQYTGNILLPSNCKKILF